MSDSTTYGNTRGRANVPRAVIHKKILDIAESRPDASMEEIADEASGATVSIVEHVLEEYGDPGNPTVESDTDDGGDTESGDDSDDGRDGDDTNDHGITSKLGPAETERAESGSADESTMSEHGSQSNGHLGPTSEPADVTDKQLETLEEIYERPRATQAELADRLGVSSATICQRVNSIDGFRWSNRRAFVTNLFGNEANFGTDDGRVGDEDGFDGADEDDVDDDSGDEFDSDDGAGFGDGDGTNFDGDGALDRRERVDSDTALNSDNEEPTDGGDRDTKTPLEEPTPERSSSSNATEVPLSAIDSLEELTDQIVEVRERLETVEDQLANEPPSIGVLSDLEFTHKIVHACLSADHITEEEELALLKEVTTDEFGST